MRGLEMKALDEAFVEGEAAPFSIGGRIAQDEAAASRTPLDSRHLSR
jgi:hypothetical protein